MNTDEIARLIENGSWRSDAAKSIATGKVALGASQGLHRKTLRVAAMPHLLIFFFFTNPGESKARLPNQTAKQFARETLSTKISIEVKTTRGKSTKDATGTQGKGQRGQGQPWL